MLQCFCYVNMFCVFLICCFGLLLFCYLCLLVWSRCCSCFVLFGLLCLCLFFPLCLFLSVVPAILVFLVQCAFNLCFSFQFLALAFCFCSACFLIQDVPLFVFFCLLSCFVLNHNIRFPFALYLLFLLLFLWLICFGIL